MIVVLGIPEAIARFTVMAIAGRAAASASTHASAPVVVSALRAEAPVRTGALRDSIGVVDQEEDATSSTVTVGARVPYDRFYQQGTSRQPPRPYTDEVAEVVDTAIGQIASAIFHKAIG